MGIYRSSFPSHLLANVPPSPSSASRDAPYTYHAGPDTIISIILNRHANSTHRGPSPGFRPERAARKRRGAAKRISKTVPSLGTPSTASPTPRLPRLRARTPRRSTQPRRQMLRLVVAPTPQASEPSPRGTRRRRCHRHIRFKVPERSKAIPNWAPKSGWGFSSPSLVWAPWERGSTAGAERQGGPRVRQRIQ
jgi:hypothetical protein